MTIARYALSGIAIALAGGFLFTGSSSMLLIYVSIVPDSAKMNLEKMVTFLKKQVFE